MSDRYDNINEIIPEALDPYDEVLITKLKFARRWHLNDDGEPPCDYGGVDTEWKEKELIIIAPHYEICSKCEDILHEK